MGSFQCLGACISGVWASGRLARHGRSGSGWTGQCRLTGIVSLGRGGTRNPLGEAPISANCKARANQHRP
jgi:hypothetical protein